MKANDQKHWPYETITYSEWASKFAWYSRTDMYTTHAYVETIGKHKELWLKPYKLTDNERYEIRQFLWHKTWKQQPIMRVQKPCFFFFSFFSLSNTNPIRGEGKRECTNLWIKKASISRNIVCWFLQKTNTAFSLKLQKKTDETTVALAAKHYKS